MRGAAVGHDIVPPALGSSYIPSRPLGQTPATWVWTANDWASACVPTAEADRRLRAPVCAPWSPQRLGNHVTDTYHLGRLALLPRQARGGRRTHEAPA